MNSNPSLQAAYDLSKALMTDTKNFFEKMLTVSTLSTLSNSNSFTCGGVNVPTFSNEPVDLFVKIKANNDANSGTFASALICASLRNRPAFGIYFLNLAKINSSKLRRYYYFSVFVHEFTHILGFDGDRLGKTVEQFSNTLIPEDKVVKGNFPSFNFSKNFFIFFSKIFLTNFSRNYTQLSNL